MRLVRVSKSGCKCVSCGEKVRSGEGFWQGQNYRVKLGRYVDDRSERYCEKCYEVAQLNCGTDYNDQFFKSPTCSENRQERMRESYSSYDNPDAFWRDADAGYFG
tara:strand:- start:2629 stop:2943 length:315 start_codon:yes stop_codon:yes gene_type:complete